MEHLSLLIIYLINTPREGFADDNKNPKAFFQSDASILLKLIHRL